MNRAKVDSLLTSVRTERASQDAYRLWKRNGVGALKEGEEYPLMYASLRSPAFAAAKAAFELWYMTQKILGEIT